MRPAADGLFLAALRPDSEATQGRIVIAAVAQDGAIIRETPYATAVESLGDTAVIPTETAAVS